MGFKPPNQPALMINVLIKIPKCQILGPGLGKILGGRGLKIVGAMANSDVRAAGRPGWTDNFFSPCPWHSDVGNDFFSPGTFARDVLPLPAVFQAPLGDPGFFSLPWASVFALWALLF